MRRDFMSITRYPRSEVEKRWESFCEGQYDLGQQLFPDCYFFSQRKRKQLTYHNPLPKHYQDQGTNGKDEES